MRIGAFDVHEPVPTLRNPRLLVALRPWIDAGSVGTMALGFLEERWQAREFAALARPGDFYDLTRYRPTVSVQDGQRVVTLPNTTLQVAQREGGDDWLFVHALEPHAHGEDYVESLIEVMRFVQAQTYCLLGSMYAPVPHTRPPVLSGSGTTTDLQERLERLGVRPSSYEGPTSVVALLTEEARAKGIATASFLVQLPAYAQLDPDYRGWAAILELLNGLYDLDLDLSEPQRRGERQYAAITRSIEGNPPLRAWVQELEATRDSEGQPSERSETGPSLSPDLERFLKEVQRDLDQPDVP